MKVTFYCKPDGRQVVEEITRLHPEDEKFFEDNGISISMEDIGDMFAVYADLGIEDDDGEPVELLELSQSRSCEDTLKALHIQCEEFFIEYT